LLAAAIVATISTITPAVKTSRLPSFAILRKRRGTITRATRMSARTPTIAIATRTATFGSGGASPPDANAGTSSMSGITARSWKSETPRNRRAKGAPISSRVARIGRTTAVEPSAIKSP
jgi:hypothetical protein